MKINGTLPIQMIALVGQTTIKSNQVVMYQQTTADYYNAQKNVKEGQWIGIADLASMTKLVDANGREYQITYDMLASTSRQNHDYLRKLQEDLDAKERAESESMALEQETSTESA